MHMTKGAAEVAGMVRKPGQSTLLLALVAAFVGTLTWFSYSIEQRAWRSQARIQRQADLDRALITAVTRGDVAGARSLLQQGADPNAKEHGVGSDIEGHGGWPALMVAAEGKDNGMAQLLVDHGADVNVQDVRGHTPLMVAAYLGHSGAVKAMLGKGANVGIRRMNGDTALRFAVQQNHPDIVSLLKRAGAKE